MFKIGEIRELIRLLDETSVSELKVESGEMKLHIRKPEPSASTVAFQPAAPSASSSVVEVGSASAASPQAPAGSTVTAASTQGPSAEGADDESASDENATFITSPMVGTFYRAPSPEADAYVEVGSKVSEKAVVCIVEAMKLMNEIEAEVSGVVVDVLAENGQLVEYGQPLFKIQRS